MQMISGPMVTRNFLAKKYIRSKGRKVASFAPSLFLCEKLNLEFNPVKDVGKETYLVYFSDRAIYRIVPCQENILSIGDILQIQVKRLAKLSFCTVQANAKFGIHPEITA